MITEEKIARTIVYISNLIEGALNPMVKCNRVKFQCVPTKGGTMAWSSSSTGSIIFHIPRLYNYCVEECQYQEDKDMITSMLYIVAHEKSHLDQDINMIRYHNDIAYHNWIEDSNNKNAIKWIIDHANYLQRCLGPLNIDVLKGKYELLQQDGNTGYISMTPAVLVSKIMNKYIAQINDDRLFRDYSTVLLSVKRDGYTTPPEHWVVKRGNAVINPNQLTPIIDLIEDYYQVSCRGYFFPRTNAVDVRCTVHEVNRRYTRTPYDLIAMS